MFHLTARVAWHDSRWNGAVCRSPSRNSFCVALDRIHKERDDDVEDKLAESPWNELPPERHPPCKAESGAFMNSAEWTRRFDHPYAANRKAAKTHGHLLPTSVQVPPFATFAVPFAWMLQSEQDEIDQRHPEPLPPAEDAPFPSPWVFGRERQKAVLDLFRNRITPERTLVFFYCKNGHPLGEVTSRLVIGVGRVLRMARPKAYLVNGTRPTQYMWDLLFRHSIRQDGTDGFLLPYHDYVEPTGDPTEDARRLGLLGEIAIAPDPARMKAFSYAAELASPDVALSTLVRCLAAVRKIRAHGIAKGPWERREEWLNDKIASVWQERGAFPGIGSLLEALGMRLGTALTLELLSSGAVEAEDDPWPILDAMIRGRRAPPQPAYEADIRAVRETWTNLPEERRDVLKLLSRFALSTAQAKRWFDPARRARGTSGHVSDEEILANPYRMSEVDLGDRKDSPVSVGIIDRGLLPDSTVAVRHPVPVPSSVESISDVRRVRAAIVSVLRHASEKGDSLLGVTEALYSLATLDLSHPCDIASDWPTTNRSALQGVVDLVQVTGLEPGGQPIDALQLSDLREREDRVRLILAKRAAKPTLQSYGPWRDLLVAAIARAGGTFEATNERHVNAIEEQAVALDQLISRRMTVLAGRAGTGKTSVMGALMLCEPIAKDGILLLAPTGKARVRLARATNAEAMTVAQFLYRLGRYDGVRQRPSFKGKEKHRKEKTVVVDESSMLTLDDMAAILLALDLAHVQRIILVGDPNQLPPIGVGRPFADLVSYLQYTTELAEDGTPLSQALAKLTVEVRVASDNDASDTLRLASWFTSEPQPVDADRVLSDLELGATFNDLDLVFWTSPDDLHVKLLQAFNRHLGLRGTNDLAGFNFSLGIDSQGRVPFDSPNGSERWQILSPVRMHPYGVHDLNRYVQRRFRNIELGRATNGRGWSLGDENIVIRDKIIQTFNQKRIAYDGTAQGEYYLANGEVGLVAPGGRNGWLNVLFAGRPGLRFGYRKRDFPGGAGPLELAYALTVHKSQGSEFERVFVILPKNCANLSRELLYTALTRSRDHLILLIEGNDATSLFELSQPERSETARRNTNLFQGVVRIDIDAIPHAEHLIHRTQSGHLVRSKSELVIANILYELDIEYEYERVCEGTIKHGRLRPDFSFVAPDGELIIWEHLGMLDRPDYRRGWKWKQQWYAMNGFVEGETLFTSEEGLARGLDSAALRNTALAIKALV